LAICQLGSYTPRSTPPEVCSAHQPQAALPRRCVLQRTSACPSPSKSRCRRYSRPAPGPKVHALAEVCPVISHRLRCPVAVFCQRMSVFPSPSKSRCQRYSKQRWSEVHASRKSVPSSATGCVARSPCSARECPSSVPSKSRASDAPSSVWVPSPGLRGSVSRSSATGPAARSPCSARECPVSRPVKVPGASDAPSQRLGPKSRPRGSGVPFISHRLRCPVAVFCQRCPSSRPRQISFGVRRRIYCCRLPENVCFPSPSKSPIRDTPVVA